MLIELKDVNKTYQGAQPLHVLKGIDLTIGKGEFVSIMGASGSGKSTLLNILGILDNYDSGEYRINGNLIWNLSETKAAEYRNKMIGFIFQSYNLIGFKTAAENGIDCPCSSRTSAPQPTINSEKTAALRCRTILIGVDSSVFSVRDSPASSAFSGTGYKALAAL